MEWLPLILAGLAALLLAARAIVKWRVATPEDMPGPLRPGAPLPYAIAIAGGVFWWACRIWPL